MTYAWLDAYVESKSLFYFSYDIQYAFSKLCVYPPPSLDLFDTWVIGYWNEIARPERGLLFHFLDSVWNTCMVGNK